MQAPFVSPKQEILNRRLPFVTGGLVIVSIILLLALARYQSFSPDVRREFEIRSLSNTSSIERLPAERGVIYDRDNVPFAFNVLQYEIGVSPNLISNPAEVARQLGLILSIDEFAILQRIINNRDTSWQPIARNVSAEVGQAVADEDLLGVVINPLRARAYPQGSVAGPLIGFVIPDDNQTNRGVVGIEASYNDRLSGNPLSRTVSTIPFELTLIEEEESADQRGVDVVLTIDRDLQFYVEQELREAVLAQANDNVAQPVRGTAVVLDPRNGDVLAMASYPTFDPNNYANVEDANLLRIPAINDVFEPGSIIKVLTVAGALETGSVGPSWTYFDEGVIEVGGVVTRNWDRQSYGVTSLADVLIQSLNVGTATLAVEEMGPDVLYDVFTRFGIGQQTLIDLPNEEAGIVYLPGDDRWSESAVASNSYGQGLSVTAIQMATAFSAIANDGLMYQPRVVREIIDGDEIIRAETNAQRVISSRTADLVTEMMVRVVNEGATRAAIDGYSIAGKTGTAQVLNAIGDETGSTASFVGFLPADDPQAVILVVLENPRDYWGSIAAAPLFRDIAERVLLLQGIPDDAVRAQLEAQGGSISEGG